MKRGSALHDSQTPGATDNEVKSRTSQANKAQVALRGGSLQSETATWERKATRGGKSDTWRSSQMAGYHLAVRRLKLSIKL